MPESVFTQTMPLLLAGGVCCCAVGLAGVVEDAEELDGVGIAVGVGLDVAGGGVLELSADADFCERDFFGAPASAAVASALSAVSVDFLERLFLLVVAAGESPAG